MSWKIIPANSVAERAPWVSIGVHNKNHGLQAKISMSATIVEHLGVENGDKVMVLRGFDEHEGWIQIEKSPRLYDHGMTLTNRKAAKGNLSFRVNAAHFNLKYHKTVKITVKDAALLLTKIDGIPVIQFEIPESMKEQL